MSSTDISLVTLNPRNRCFEKIWNSYIRLPLPWRFRPAPHRNWENQGQGEHHGPDQFIHLTPSSHVLLSEIELLEPDQGAAILDLGCNVGRHLQALWSKGYRNLHGVDIQHAALSLMASVFPEMKAGSQVRQGTFQDYLRSSKDRSFDIVFSHGATIELVPPNYPICQQIARVSARAVVIVISESGHSYPRLWETEFLREGFLLTKLLRPVCSGGPSSLLVFRRME